MIGRAQEELLPPVLPSSEELIREGRERGERLTPAVTRYQARHGVTSERFYKERCRADGTITYYINLGLKSWPETRDALAEVSDRCHRLGIRVDRVSLTADRRMGLLPAARVAAPEETGIMFWTPEDWEGIARETELQGIINDHAIGSPASVPNAAAAIEAGVSYVGNLAQQHYSYPAFPSDVDQMASTVIGIAMVAAQRKHGVVLDSYIDDGYCGSFHDAATSLGWCMLHRYIAEDLIGAAYSPSYGSTFADPTIKAAFGRALDAINTSRVPPSLVHGDTNSLDPSFTLDRHAATVTTDVFFTIANQLASPTGAAVHATPLTEPVRIPTVDDIVQSLEIANEAERRARAAASLVDWGPVDQLRDRIVEGGRVVYRRMLDGLRELGVDTSDPLELLVVTKRLGAGRIEELWGAGESDAGFPRGFVPVCATDTLRRALERREAVMEEIRKLGPRIDLVGHTVIAASSDVHEYGLHVLVYALAELGCRVIDLGTSVGTDAMAAAAAEVAADSIALSTYNGGALSVAKELLERMQRRGLAAKLFVGGRLTQDLDDLKSVDVSEQIAALGAYPCQSVGDMVLELSRSAN
jgi:methylmalonyl-CoA mutase cobalamin-binding subunit